MFLDGQCLETGIRDCAGTFSSTIGNLQYMLQYKNIYFYEDF